MNETPSQRLARQVVTSLAVLAVVVFALVAFLENYALAREIWLLRSTGYAALTGLFLALSMTPLGRVLRRLAPGRVTATTLLAFRRAFGIASACFALVHAELTLMTYLRGSWPTILHTPYLRAGLATLVILTVLLLTSFPRLTRLLQVRLWNELHRLDYVAAFLLFQHMLLSPFAPRRWTLVLFGGLLVVEALRFLPARR